MLSPRNRELLGLVPSALLVIAGFTAIFIQAEDNAPGASTNLTLNHASSASLTYGALFLALCLAAHVVIRYALPNADPYLFPLVAVLASVGVVMVYRIDPVLARQQAQWMIVGLILFAATILALRRRGVGGARALSLHDRRGRDRDDAAAAPAGARASRSTAHTSRSTSAASPSSPPSSRRSRSSSSSRATCATTARSSSPPGGACSA